MKHTREQLDGMSEWQVNVLLRCLLLGGDWLNHADVSDSMKHLCLHDAAGNPYFEDVPDYCNNWNDIMPLAVEYDVFIDAGAIIECEHKFVAYSSLMYNYQEIIGARYEYSHNNPQRAIACCLIMVLESKNN